MKIRDHLARIAGLKRTKHDCINIYLYHHGFNFTFPQLVYGSLGAVAGGSFSVYT